MPTVYETFAALALPGVRDYLGTLRDPAAEDNALLYRGDHWGDGRFWLGEVPEGDPGTFLAAVERGFIAINHIGEVIDRHRAGILGREPRWGLAVRRPLAEGEEPTDDERARIDEAEALLTTWWDRRDMLIWLHQPTAALLLSGRAVARLYIPSGRLNLDQGASGLVALPPGGDAGGRVAAALDYLHIDIPDRDAAGVFVDNDSKARLGVFNYQREQQQWAELTYLDANGATVLRVIGTQEGQQALADGVAWPLGGRLLMYEARREPLVDAQMRRLQQAANLNLTNLGRNLNLAGSRERTFLGAQPPGEWRRISDGKLWGATDDANDREFVAGSLPTGSGQDRFLQGVPIYNQRGEVIGMTSPSLHYEQPVSVETFNVANTLFREAILSGADQLHALISGDATATGESRKQARAEFASSLGLTKLVLDGLGRWLIETPLALAAHLAGFTGRYDDLRAQFDTVVDPGPITADERREYLSQWQAGAMSLERLLSMLGEDDVVAEMAKIAAEREERAATGTDPVTSLQRVLNGSGGG